MDIVGIIARILAAIAVFIMIALVVGTYRLSHLLYSHVDYICSKILYPAQKIGALLVKLGGSIPAICHIILISIISLASCVFLISFYQNYDNIQDFLQMIANNTTVVAFTDFLNQLIYGDLSVDTIFNFGTLASVGISSLLSFLYLNYTLNRIGNHINNPILSFFLVIVVNAVFFCVSAIFASFSADNYNVLASILLDRILNPLGHVYGAANIFIRILLSIYNIIVTLLLVYAVVVTFTVVIREYLAVICYGIIGLFALYIFSLIAEGWLHLPDIYNSVILLILLLVMEFVRAYTQPASTS